MYIQSTTKPIQRDCSSLFTHDIRIIENKKGRRGEDERKKGEGGRMRGRREDGREEEWRKMKKRRGGTISVSRRSGKVKE